MQDKTHFTIDRNVVVYNFSWDLKTGVIAVSKRGLAGVDAAFQKCHWNTAALFSGRIC